MSREYCEKAPNHPVHALYHNTEYGFSVRAEKALFERLSMEIMQAGLSWETVLKKRKALNKAFDCFDVSKIAAYGIQDVARLMADESIIRNRRKIEAVIDNAKTVLALRQTHGSFAKWLEAHHPQSKPELIKLFKKIFASTGGEITGEFLMSIGYLPGAHEPDCKIYKTVMTQSPPWHTEGRPRR